MYYTRSRGLVLNPLKGFTLIELLVVIAIIGILSAVVLASLSTARSKGQDAAIQSDLTGAQTQAEIFYSGTGANSYTNLCADTTVDRAFDAADAANGTLGAFCTSSATAYAITAQLVAVPADYWCVDSTGNSRRVTGTAAAITVCP